MTAQLPFSPVYGGHRQVDNILKNVPHWWDTRDGSRFFALLSALGISDWKIGGDQIPLVKAWGTGTAGSATFSDGAQSWDVDAYVDMYLQDSSRNRFLILSNTSQVLTLASGSTPASGSYKIIQAGNALQEVRYDGFVRTAVANDLETLGRNVGVRRPTTDMSDDVFRKLIPLLSWEPKQTRLCVEKVLTALFGEKRSWEHPDRWDCFEISNNEIVVEVYTSGTLPAGRASYLLTDESVHDGDPGVPLTSYVVPDAEQPRPEGRLGLILAGSAFTGDGGTIDAEALKRILATYVRATGVRVTVEFFEART